MANLRILVPEESTNYILNPAIRTATTGWVAAGATISRTQNRARFGQACLQVVTAGSVLREGAYYRALNMAGISGPCTVSAYVRGSGTIRIRLIDNPTGGEWASKSIALNDIRWQRIEVSGRSSGSDDMRLYVETDGRIQEVTFYVDGAQMEPKPYSTTYMDGEQPGCRWNIVADASISTRDDDTRWGGKWVSIAGPCTGNDNLYVTKLGGMGMPPIEHQKQSWALAPGSFYQGTKITDRVMTFLFHAKSENFRLVGAPRLDRLHELRQMLIDVIKPDRTPGAEAYLLEYSEGDYPLYIRARYEAGLEGDWDIRNAFVDSFPVRMLAVDPFWVEDTQEIISLALNSQIPATSLEFAALGRVDGAWQALSAPASIVATSGAISCMALGPNGEVYAGIYTDIGIYVAYWNGSSWTFIGGTFNAPINAIAIAPTGYVYVGGEFTIAGGVAANNAAYWNGSSWNAMGSGLNDTCYAVCVAQNGNVIFGGAFTTANGVSRRYLAGWNGSWYGLAGGDPLGNPSGNTVYSLVVGRDDRTIYVGGSFYEIGYSNGGRICSYDIIANAISYLGYGFTSGAVYAIGVGLDGRVFAGGTMVASGPAGADQVSCPYIAVFNGASWAAMDGSMNGQVRAISMGTRGEVYAGGAFTTAGGRLANGLAVFENNIWTRTDIHKGVSGAGTAVECYSLLAHPNGDLYVGINVSSLAAANSHKISGITTVNNIGTAEVHPILMINGAANLRYIENITAQKKYFINITTLSGEIVMIDFARGTVTSNYRGNVLYRVEPGSESGAFTLLPGQNRIAAFIVDDTNASAYLYYEPIHWSADAVADADDL